MLVVFDNIIQTVRVWAKLQELHLLNTLLTLDKLANTEVFQNYRPCPFNLFIHALVQINISLITNYNVTSLKIPLPLSVFHGGLGAFVVASVAAFGLAHP